MKIPGPRELLAKAFRETANPRRLKTSEEETMPDPGVKERQAESGTKSKPEKTAFGKRFNEVMTTAGFGTPKQIEIAIAGKKKVCPFSYKQIYDLYYEANPATIDDVGERAPLLKACAKIAGVPMSAFFGTAPVAALIGTEIDSELLEKAAEALAGPKREFLADAIDMSYSALEATKSRYRSHS